ITALSEGRGYGEAGGEGLLGAKDGAYRQSPPTLILPRSSAASGVPLPLPSFASGSPVMARRNQKP
ncbi:MAG TPA: hypothetical protein VMG63_13080, partial [Terriglobia bacterium]|nr:hypothetical protein [Terriglobia bacterium]